MIPAKFAYEAPTTVDEAVGLLAKYGDEARILAGGHSLIPLMRLRLAAPAVLIDIGGIDRLVGISVADGQVTIGARTTHTALEDSAELSTHCPLLQEAARVIGDRQVRNCGTIGGSLAHADPGGDLPAAALALDAQLEAVSASGTRTIAITDFFQGPLTTALRDDELLTTIRVPALGERTGTAYTKFLHPASGYAVCGVAAVVELSPSGECARVRVGITGAGSTAVRASAVETALTGQTPNADHIRAAAEHAAEGLDLNEDIFASAEYRAHLARVFTRRALAQAASRAAG